MMNSINVEETLALSISVKDQKSEKIVQDAKIKAIKNKAPLSEVVLKLLDKWNKGDVEIEVNRNA